MYILWEHTQNAVVMGEWVPQSNRDSAIPVQNLYSSQHGTTMLGATIVIKTSAPDKL